MEINKTVSILLILLIAVTAFFVFVVPEYQRSKELELNLETRQAQYANQSSYYAKTSETLSKIENNQDALAKINSALPSELSLSSIVYFLQKKGAEAGMSVKSVTFSGAPSDAYVSPVAVDAKGMAVKKAVFIVDVSGSYQGLKTFLRSIDTSSRIFETDSITFASGQTLASNKLSTDFVLEIVTHTY